MERSSLDWSIRALLMAAGTGLVVGALRIRAASALHHAWTAAMIAMLLLPVWTSWGPSLTAPVLPAAREAMIARFEAPAPLETPLDTVVRQAEPSQSVAAQARVIATSEVDWQQLLLAIYLAGFAAMMARLVAGTLRIRSMQRRARQADGFITAPFCAAPVTIGWLRPVLLLPGLLADMACLQTGSGSGS